jgi:hypothetical protein
MRSSDVALPLVQQHRIPTLIHPLHASIPRRLAPALLTPSLGPHIRTPSDAYSPRAIIAPGSPRPAGAARNREVIEPKAKPRRRDAN